MRIENVSFLGAGAIAEAMIRGLLNAGLVSEKHIRVANREEGGRRDALARHYGVQAVSRKEAIRRAEVIVLAMKPKDAGDAMVEVRDHLQGTPLLVSVMAGITTGWIEGQLGREVPVVRAMPNTSCGVGESATALASGRYAGDEHLEIARKMFGAVGRVVTVPESRMDAVTGLSGSGPAYVYYLVEALIEAGKQMGIDEEVCRTLVVQTVFGAAVMLRTGERPDALRRQVTSPGGTTQAGIEVLDRRDVAGAIQEAVRRATERSRELQEAWTPSTVSDRDR
ncbi:MAG: pyrroline-5-carboxylate reductase [Kyrpidia sp.]|nr:pyrroline-5-carboxylate reductase [Kyrpidia sp.]